MPLAPTPPAPARAPAAQCRLCWDPEGAPPDGLLLSPCRCKGSVAHIHRGCLQRWLDTRPRAACDVCRSPYDGALLAGAGVRMPPPELLEERRPRHDLLAARFWLHLDPAAAWPGAGRAAAAAAARARRGAPPRPAPWFARDPRRDARFWAGLLHGAWRAAVAADGAAATLAMMRRRRMPAPGGWFWRRGPLALPCGTAEEVRSSFDATTQWQVQLYSALVALSPRGALSEACSGMALGAIIGGCLSSVAFLPLVGLPRLVALAGSLRLAARAGSRLAAGLACRPCGHRRLAAALAAAARPLAWAARGAAGLLSVRRRAGGERPPRRPRPERQHAQQQEPQPQPQPRRQRRGAGEQQPQQQQRAAQVQV